MLSPSSAGDRHRGEHIGRAQRRDGPHFSLGQHSLDLVQSQVCVSRFHSFAPISELVDVAALQSRSPDLKAMAFKLYPRIS